MKVSLPVNRSDITRPTLLHQDVWWKVLDLARPDVGVAEAILKVHKNKPLAEDIWLKLVNVTQSFVVLI